MFWTMLGHVESAQLSGAAEAAHAARDQFMESARLFMEIAAYLERFPGLTERVRTVEVETASRAVFRYPRREELELMEQDLRNGRPISDVFRTCAAKIERFAGAIDYFQRRLQSQPNTEPDFEFVHRELIARWTNLLAVGQYVSAVCLLATEGKISTREKIEESI
jgi:hypothetical protein